MKANIYNGQSIRMLADQRGITVKDLSEMMNVTRQSVYEVFRKESLKRATVLKFLDAMGAKESDVLALQNTNIKENVQESKDDYIAKLLAKIEKQENVISEQTNTIAQLAQANLSLIEKLGKFSASGLLAVLDA
ncbi:helix-turn-helix domain-containing protein [Spirosoma litoris]